MESATKTADKIIKAYPDYGKAPASYLKTLVEVILSYPIEFHDAFANLKTGVPSRTKFLPTPFDFSEMASELQLEVERQRRLADMDARFKATALAAPDGPYVPKQPVRYYDRRGNEISAKEAAERLEQHKRDIASMAKVNSITSYVKYLGGGDALKGWEIMIERGLTEVPAEWKSS